MASPFNDLSPAQWQQLLRTNLNVQSGSGVLGYRGLTAYQRGYGLGSIFRTIFRIARPAVQKVAKHVAKEGLQTAALVGTDLLEGQDLKESLKTRTKEGATKLVRRAADKVISPRLRGYKKLEESPPKSSKKKVTRKKPIKQQGKGQIGYKKNKKSRKRTKQIGSGLRNTKKKSDYFGLI